MDSQFDSIIVGAGISGCLAAARIIQKDPSHKILLLEREKCWGGRLAPESASGFGGYGLHLMDESMLRFWEESLPPFQDDIVKILDGFKDAQVQQAAVLSAQQLTTFPINKLLEEPGVRAIGGAAAWRDWKKNILAYQESLAKEVGQTKLHKTVAQSWPTQRKSPAAIIYEHLSRLSGIADLWQSSDQCVWTLLNRWTTPLYRGPWDSLFSHTVALLNQSEHCKVAFEAPVIDAERSSDGWKVHSRTGIYGATNLIVAHNPWDALLWLPKSYWPVPLLQFAAKVKPVSAVTLNEFIEISSQDVAPIPDVILVPSENCQVHYSAAHRELCYQATIDYEVSLQAPDVVKAVRRLKRARKKLHAVLNGIQSQGEHIALLPVAWSHPTTPSELKYQAKLKDSKFQDRGLYFCGDAYGNSFIAEENIRQSVLSVVEELMNSNKRVHQNQQDSGLKYRQTANEMSVETTSIRDG